MLPEKLNHLSEEKLIAACKKQDRKAQREIYERYSARMYSVCVRYMADKEEAKDILQDGFVTVFTKIESYSGDGSFEGWMRRVFANTALMKLRKKDVLSDTKDIGDLRLDTPFVDNVMENISRKEIYRLISQMPPGFRSVFNLNIVEGYSHLEIAQMLNISEGASRSQLSRARGWLRDKIYKMEK